MLSRDFWAGKRVFLTGHTGFKGGWTAVWLRSLGAEVTGYALAPPAPLSFFDSCKLDGEMTSILGDIRHPETISRAMAEHRPEIVLHMAAQPLVRLSYKDPVATLETNIMGTVHVLEAARKVPDLRAAVVITSDKCYENRGWIWGYREDEAMGGHDPYSASKGCTELVTAAYQRSFFQGKGATVVTARAGNVIGGGDWAEDRILPDAIRALGEGQSFLVRNPAAVRPWQHVLEAVAGYLMLAEKVYLEQSKWEGGWNFGPRDQDAIPVSALSDLIVRRWRGRAAWHSGPVQTQAPHEAAYLKLDSSKARHFLAWDSRLTVQEAVDWTVDWYREALQNTQPGQMLAFTRRQIEQYQDRVPRADSVLYAFS